MNPINQNVPHAPWNKGKLIGQKSPLKLKEIWAIRIRLQMAKNTRELALFNLAIDSKLRGCDLVKLKVGDVAGGGGSPTVPKRTLVPDISQNTSIKPPLKSLNRQLVYQCAKKRF